MAQNQNKQNNEMEWNFKAVLLKMAFACMGYIWKFPHELDSQRQAGQGHQSVFPIFWKALSNDHLYSNGLRYKTYYFFDEAESANPNYLDVVQQEP